MLGGARGFAAFLGALRADDFATELHVEVSTSDWSSGRVGP